VGSYSVVARFSELWSTGVAFNTLHHLDVKWDGTSFSAITDTQLSGPASKVFYLDDNDEFTIFVRRPNAFGASSAITVYANVSLEVTWNGYI
jgi:hypothetical protein